MVKTDCVKSLVSSMDARVRIIQPYHDTLGGLVGQRAVKQHCGHTAFRITELPQHPTLSTPTATIVE